MVDGGDGSGGSETVAGTDRGKALRGQTSAGNHPAGIGYPAFLRLKVNQAKTTKVLDSSGGAGVYVPR
jgi:hypothetical protein